MGDPTLLDHFAGCVVPREVQRFLLGEMTADEIRDNVEELYDFFEAQDEWDETMETMLAQRRSTIASLMVYLGKVAADDEPDEADDLPADLMDCIFEDPEVEVEDEEAKRVRFYGKDRVN